MHEDGPLGAAARRRRVELVLAAATPFMALLFGTGAVLHDMMRVHMNLFIAVRREIVVVFTLFPAALLACGLLALRRSRRVGGALIAVFLAMVVLRVWMFHVEPNWLASRHVVVPTPKLAAPLRIVHFSDFQSDGIDGHELRAVDRIIGARPDLVIHTGDILQPLPPLTLEGELPKAEALFSMIRPPIGFYNVVGDTDGTLVEVLATGWAGMRTLQSGVETIGHGDVRIHLAGLTLGESRMLHEPSTRARLEELQNRAQPGDLTIVMGHAPDYMLAARDYPFDLCLAGHTHGGQVNLPWIGPLITLSRVPRAWARGFRIEGATRLNVTTGVGAEHAEGLPSMRLLCRPEIVIIDLVPKGAASPPIP